MLHKTKKCIQCSEEKTLENFVIDKKCKEGRKNLCKKCGSLRTQKYKITGRTKQLKQLANKNNRCERCLKPRLQYAKTCLTHYVSNLLSAWKLNKKEKEQLTSKLIDKLEKNEYSCFYTGLALIPALNTSIDHRIPKSKGGTNDITNLEWVHRGVNGMKGDETEKEFINRSGNILVDLSLLASKGLAL